MLANEEINENESRASARRKRGKRHVETKPLYKALPRMFSVSVNAKNKLVSILLKQEGENLRNHA